MTRTWSRKVREFACYPDHLKTLFNGQARLFVERADSENRAVLVDIHFAGLIPIRSELKHHNSLPQWQLRVVL